MRFLRAGMLDGREPAPSVETPLHSVLPYRFIVHTHDFATQALTDTPRPEAQVAEALADEVVVRRLRPPRVPAGPGGAAAGDSWPIGRAGWCWAATASSPGATRPGTVTTTCTGSSTGPRPSWPSAPGAGRPFRQRDRAAAPRATAGAQPARSCPCCAACCPGAPSGTTACRWSCTTTTRPRRWPSWATRARAELAPRGMSTPEHILRCGRLPLLVAADLAAAAPAEAEGHLAAALDGYAAKPGPPSTATSPAAEMLEPTPRVVLLPGLGLVTAMKDKAGALVGNLCYRHVMRVMEAAEALGGFRFLDEAQAIEFEYWPLELAQAQAAGARADRPGRAGHRRRQRHRPGHRRAAGRRAGPRRPHRRARRGGARGGRRHRRHLQGPPPGARGRRRRHPRRRRRRRRDRSGARLRRARHPGGQRRLHRGRARSTRSARRPGTATSRST